MSVRHIFPVSPTSSPTMFDKRRRRWFRGWTLHYM